GDKRRRDGDRPRRDGDRPRRDDRKGPRGEGVTEEKRAENPRKRIKPATPDPRVEEVKAEAPAEAENKQ
ncbi:MAG: hypothetical protein PHE94_01470, partial [Eubacteriales bacterium]|nr:hypothetical protein [Eubacteriales bacterium]